MTQENSSQSRFGFVMPTLYRRRDLIAKVVGFPEWMPPELRALIRGLVEDRAIKITGLYGGAYLHRAVDGTIKIDNPAYAPIIHWEELADFTISNALNFWAECAENYATGTFWCEEHKFKAGVDILFFEPNATHTAAVRVWKGYDLFPESSGLKESYKDPSEDSVTDAPLTYAIRFEGEIVYNQPNDHGTAINVLSEADDYGVVPDWAKFYYNTEPQHTLVLTIDPADPDPTTTVKTLLRTWGSVGVSVSIRVADDAIMEIAPALNWEPIKELPEKFDPAHTTYVRSYAIQKLVWSDPAEPTEKCNYNHSAAQCGLGEYRIEWKGWKQYDGRTLYHNGEYVETFNDLESAQAGAQKHLETTILGCTHEAWRPVTITGQAAIGNEVPEGWAVPKDTPV